MKHNAYPTPQSIQKILRSAIDSTPEASSAFFKTGPGEYAETDRFLGIKTPTVRRIAKRFSSLSLGEIEYFLQSNFNAERLFAIIILVSQYRAAAFSDKETIYQFYLKNIHHINNWNLVDNSAYQIMGAHLWNQKRLLLTQFARSKNLWKRRISIIATRYFVKHQDFQDTLNIATILLHDKHDLIHKACGWMLREVGKENLSVLVDFLEHNHISMPKTMLRYATEKLPRHMRETFHAKN